MESGLREIIYLSLGSNLGDREANLESVFEELPPAIEVIMRSSIYQTEPWGFEDQPEFLNMVAQGKILNFSKLIIYQYLSTQPLTELLLLWN